MNYNEDRKFRFLAALICLALFWCAQSFIPSGKAFAASCRHAGSKSKTLAVGSQVDGDLVTICLNKTLQKKLLTVSRPIPKPLPKATLSAKPKPKPIIRVKTLPKPALPKPAIHKPVIHTKLRTNTNNGRAVFRPKAPTATVSPTSVLKVAQQARFVAVAKVLFGRSQLLGNPVLVRFTPTKLTWVFGDGAQIGGGLSSASVTSHGYATAGNYVVLLHTTFSVSYKLANGSWLADPDNIVLASTPINLAVGVQAAKLPAKSVLVTSG